MPLLLRMPLGLECYLFPHLIISLSSTFHDTLKSSTLILIAVFLQYL